MYIRNHEFDNLFTHHNEIESMTNILELQVLNILNEKGEDEIYAQITKRNLDGAISVIENCQTGQQ